MNLKAVAIVLASASLTACSGNAGPAVPSPTSQLTAPLGSNATSTLIYLIRNGDAYQAIKASVATVFRSTDGLHVVNAVSHRESIYPASAVVVRETVVSALAPMSATPLYLRSTCAAFDPPSGLGSTHVALSAAPMLDGGGAGSNWGDLTSSNADCMDGGANLGFSFTVPNTYPGAVDVTICVKGDVCYVFPNEQPGSSHNVSIWQSGAAGQYSASMGIVFDGTASEGVGSSSMPGCSDD